MMKFVLLAVFVIVAVFSSGVSSALTDGEVQDLLNSLQEITASENLSCGGEKAYCQNNSQGRIPSWLCPIVLKAYLCDNVTSVSDLRKVLESAAG